MRKRWIAGLLALLLVAAAVPASAGVLTAGNFAYVINGQEQTLPVDILTLQGATLVPSELLQVLGVTPESSDDHVTLGRGPVKVEMRLGAEAATVDGKRRLLKAGPVTVGGRLFLPAEILPELGISLTVDGRFVVVHDYVAAAASGAAGEGQASGAGTGADGAATAGPVADGPDFKTALAAHTVQSPLRDGNSLGTVTLTRLTPQLLQDPALPVPWGARVRLLSLAPDQTLLMVTLKNQPALGYTMAIDPAKLMPVDESGHQLDYSRVEVSVDGNVTAPLAPGAVHTSVLAYDRSGGPLTVYYAGYAGVLGRFGAP